MKECPASSDATRRSPSQEYRAASTAKQPAANSQQPVAPSACLLLPPGHERGAEGCCLLSAGCWVLSRAELCSRLLKPKGLSRRVWAPLGFWRICFGVVRDEGTEPRDRCPALVSGRAQSGARAIPKNKKNFFFVGEEGCRSRKARRGCPILMFWYLSSRWIDCRRRDWPRRGAKRPCSCIPPREPTDENNMRRIGARRGRTRGLPSVTLHPPTW